QLVRNKLGPDGSAASAGGGGATSGRTVSSRTVSKGAGSKGTASEDPAPSKGSGTRKKTKKARPKKASPRKAGAGKKRVAKTASKKTSAKLPSKKAAPAKKKAGKKRRVGRPRAGGGDRDRELDLVERTIRSSKGLSAGEIMKRTKLARPRVSAAVRQLKDAGRIQQGGDRRFARYAADKKTAIAASEAARNNASGPRRGR
ncbi:MAG: hypothetical protein AAGN82_07610, partial [Myxococcota bacterium]